VVLPAGTERRGAREDDLPPCCPRSAVQGVSRRVTGWTSQPCPCGRAAGP
jgi:hypothetical protein